MSRIDLRVPLSSDAVIERLRRATDPVTAAYRIVPGAQSGRPFMAVIRGTEFTVHQRLSGYNSFAPHLYGLIKSEGSATRITGEIRRTTFLRTGSAILAGIVAATIAVLLALRPADPGLWLVPIMAVAVVVFGFAASAGQEQALRRFLESVLASTDAEER